MADRALIAMSGGVDSSAAAVIMKNAGYDCAGATMRLHERFDGDAKAVCERLGIPFYELDCREDFRRSVMERFVDVYRSGATPNPCIECNRALKFGKVLGKALELGCDKIVTGHYARVEQDPETGRFLLKKALNKAKDQTYVLYFLSQEQLSRTILPLGERADKDEVRQIAQQCGLTVASKGESQDICFVPDGDYAGFIERFSGIRSEVGDFVHIGGERLGRHKGLDRYTIGQRRGLGIAWGEALYVAAKDPVNNVITLAEDRYLYADRLVARDFNWVSLAEPPAEPIRVSAAVRYRGREAEAEARVLPDGNVEIRFAKPQRAICPGQAVVLYDGDIVVGGGTIC